MVSVKICLFSLWVMGLWLIIQVIKAHELSASKHIRERLGNVSMRCERSAGFLCLNGKGVVETEAMGQIMMRVGERNGGSTLLSPN